MSVDYCYKHHRHFDTDFILDCPDCEVDMDPEQAETWPAREMILNPDDDESKPAQILT